MVKLKDVEPLTRSGLEVACRFAHGSPELSLEEWLFTLPDRGARLKAISDLIDNDELQNVQ